MIAFSNFAKGGWITLFASALAFQGGCDRQAPPSQLETVDLRGEHDHRAFIDLPNVWPKANPLVVCWKSGYEGREKEIEWVKASIERSWERAANIRFTGWKPCAQTRGRVDIPIYIRDAGPYVLGLGRSIREMVLNFDFQKWGCGSDPCKFSEARRRMVIEVIAIHEFGHALGLSHEHNRRDTPDSCDKAAQGPDGTLDFGEWDSISVMNYCNPNVGLNLSQTDINAVQYMYGANAAFVLGDSWLKATNPTSLPPKFLLSDPPKASTWLSGDLDNDGDDDLLSVHVDQDGETLRAYYQDDDSITAQPKRQDFGQRTPAQSWALADVNGDGSTELIGIWREAYGTLIKSHRNEGRIFFAPIPDTSIDYFSNPSTVYRFGDTNLDGRADLLQIVPTASGAELSLRESIGRGYPIGGVLSEITFAKRGATQWLFDDVTGDRRSDLVRVQMDGQAWTVCVHAANADQSFAPRGECTSGPSRSLRPQAVMSDLNGDQRSDLVLLFGEQNRLFAAPWYSEGNRLMRTKVRPTPLVHGNEQSWVGFRVKGDLSARILGLW